MGGNPCSGEVGDLYMDRYADTQRYVPIISSSRRVRPGARYPNYHGAIYLSVGGIGPAALIPD